MQIEAAIFRKVLEPLTIEAVDIDKPWGREVLVRTVATGVCHSDLHVVDGVGRFPLDRPIVLGHEGAGVVEAVGSEVTTVQLGDHVVACLSGFCGSCAQCLGGHPNLCVGGAVTRAESAAPRLSQKGQPLRQFIGISSYAERMLLHENSIVKIDRDLPLDRAALVGCGVLTGVGAGVDHAFEAVGNTKLVRQAIESLAIRGTATIVGVLPPDAMIEFPWMAIRPECRVQTSRMGSNRFRVDIPRYLEFYRQGRLLLDEMVTRRGRLGDINEAFRAMKAGEVARTVLTFD